MTPKTLLCLSILIFSLASCKKNSQDSEPHIPISDQRLKDAVTVKVGSYFVYQDSASGYIDSFYVTSYSPPYYEYNNAQNVYYEVTLFNAYNGTSSYPAPRISLGAIRDRISVTVILNDLITTGTSLSVPFTANTIRNQDAMVVYLVQHLNSYNVLGKNYTDVYETISHATDYNTSDWQHIWFSPANGIVQFSVYDTVNRYTYYLIRSKIIK